MFCYSHFFSACDSSRIESSSSSPFTATNETNNFEGTLLHFQSETEIEFSKRLIENLKPSSNKAFKETSWKDTSTGHEYNCGLRKVTQG